MALTYKEFLKKGIDLAPLGIEKSENFEEYFCTPKGANIIGTTEVDGIHYCFIKEFGEIVFAVSPCNGIGEYVHPIARSFDDFLSLLVSVGAEAALEQAWQWDSDTFNEYVRETRLADEQKEVILALKRDLFVVPMENPFEYIKALQDEFDYSKIKFSAQYYDIVEDGVESFEEPQEWQVYFGRGYWKSSTEKNCPATELVLNKTLVWGDEIWHFPSMYLCDKGFVVDCCVELNPDKVKAFFDKWYPVPDEPDISCEVRQQIESENPFEIYAHSHYTLNGKAIEEKNCCGLSYIPDSCLPSDIENPKETLAIIEHYHLDPTKAWSFHRHTCHWSTARMPNKIKSFSLSLERQPTTIKGIHFKNPSVGDVITFTHPISGVEHKLTVLEYEQQELPQNVFGNEEYEYPTHHTVMTYSIEPPLTEEMFIISDCLENDAARNMPKKSLKTDLTNDACICVIGGTDGPTAIFVTSENSSGECHTALSALHFAPTHHVEWKIEFKAKMMEDVQIDLI